MLQILHIENIAVIERADIEFEQGLNIMTGETGAGKSIVIDALGAVLGGRVSRDLVRTGADRAVVSAVFSSGGATSWCNENGIEPDDGNLLLMRNITADGKTSCRVNGVPVTVSQLQVHLESACLTYTWTERWTAPFKRAVSQELSRQYFKSVGIHR